MTNPQVEDGYTRIANELLEAICRHKFTAREYAVVLAVIRKTYGFGKKFDRLPLTQLEAMTGVTRGNLSETIKRLESCRVLFLKREQGGSQSLGINKNYTQWQVFPKQEQQKGVPDLEKTVPESGTKLFPNQEPQKKEINIQKKRGLSFVNESIWNEFLEHRKQLKKALTPVARSRLLRKLERLKGEGYDPDKLLVLAMERNWRTVYPHDEAKQEETHYVSGQRYTQ